LAVGKSLEAKGKNGKHAERRLTPRSERGTDADDGKALAGARPQEMARPFSILKGDKM
jgi:hypothetical protein